MRARLGPKRNGPQIATIGRVPSRFAEIGRVAREPGDISTLFARADDHGRIDDVLLRCPSQQHTDSSRANLVERDHPSRRRGKQPGDARLPSAVSPVFAIEIEMCRRCGGKLIVIASTSLAVVLLILRGVRCLGTDHSRARAPSHAVDFAPTLQQDARPMKFTFASSASDSSLPHAGREGFA
jgi:hypothetical protein